MSVDRRVLEATIADIEPEAADALAALPVARMPAGAVLFRPGDDPPGFVVVLKGNVAVSLTGRSGREISLYDVEPGETCVQTTLCLLGDIAYTAEAVATTPLELIIVPRGQFQRLLDSSGAFRRYVFRSLGERLADVTVVLEQVAFVRIESRLAAEILRRVGTGDSARLTHQALASAIGSAREVVSRRLESLRKQGLLSLDRGRLRVLDRSRLERLAGDSEAV